MAGFRIEGNTSGNVAEVNSLNEIKVALNTTNSNSGYATITCAGDDGSITGEKLWTDPEGSGDNRIRIGIDSMQLDENFPGTVLNSNIFLSAVSTMSASVAGGSLTLNSGLSLASGAVARVSTYKSYALNAASELYFETNIKFTLPPQTNNICEWGLFIASSISAPTDGVFFRLNQSGGLYGVINNNGAETTSSAIDFNTYVNTATTNFIISIGNTFAKFWINNNLAAYVEIGDSGTTITSSMYLPVSFRIYNSNTVGAAQQMKIMSVSVTDGDLNYNKSFGIQAVSAGLHCLNTQTGSATHGMNAQFLNSASPAAAAPANNTANLGSGLGGLFNASINGLTAGTDYIISAFLVPAGSSTVPGKSLFVTDIIVSASSEAVANGAAITNWIVGLAFGNNALTLASTQAATTKNAKRLVLGMQSIPANAPVGTIADPTIFRNFQTPICINQSEYITIFIRFKNNNSAATQRLEFAIGINGFFE